MNFVRRSFAALAIAVDCNRARSYDYSVRTRADDSIPDDEANSASIDQSPIATTYYVDEAGDGILFGNKGRNRLEDAGASQFFILGMVRCAVDATAAGRLEQLRNELVAHPLYSSIPSLQAAQRKTCRSFHAKDDHAEIRAKVFELLASLDFTFYAVIKDMRAVIRYVRQRNRMQDDYRYNPNELYDLTVRLLFKERLHKNSHYHITFARRGTTDRTEALIKQLKRTRRQFLIEHHLHHEATLEILPAYPWEEPCLQIADYCLWAVQRCYERGESRFLQTIWKKVSVIRDVDDPNGKEYGTYLTRKKPLPDWDKIKSRRI